MSGAFQAWFEERFGCAFPVPLNASLCRVPGEGDVFVSVEHPELTTHKLMTPYFPTEPSEYVVAGAWGFGTTRQAFYFVTRRDTSRAGEPGQRFDTYFRINANVSDDDSEANIVAFFEGYRDWLAAVGPAIRSGRLSYSMGYGDVALSLETPAGIAAVESKMPLASNGAVLPPRELWAKLTERARAALRT